MIIHEVFERKLEELKGDKRVKGVFITGSLARGTETEFSDLDIIVLYDENKVVEEIIDGVPVETHYNTAENILTRFIDDATSCYLYTYGKVVYEKDGTLTALVSKARERLKGYKVDEARGEYLSHKLQALTEKLSASIGLSDELKISYLVHNNFRILVECVYYLNSRPVPPQGLGYEIYNSLDWIPEKDWLVTIISLKGIKLANYVLNVTNKLKAKLAEK